jgi:predicted  nucleic acid-binding Zn-ribbon protein
VKAELEQLIALQNTDTKIRLLQAELDAIPQRRAEIEKEFEQRAFEFRALETRRDESRQKRTQLDIQLGETRVQSEKAERDLMSSTNEKAYTAAIREVDASRKQISQLETQILEQMEVSDQAEKEIREREPEINKLRAELEEKLRAFEEQARAQTEELAARRAERDRLLASLPKQMSALYNRISARIRDGIAVAEARNGSCTACFITLRPQVMAEVRRGEEVILCDNCNRILYYVPVEQTQKTSSLSAP